MEQELKSRFRIMSGGVHTTLIFKHGYELPEFAAFVLLRDDKATKIIREDYIDFIKVALKHKVSIELLAVTYKAHPDIAKKVGLIVIVVSPVILLDVLHSLGLVWKNWRNLTRRALSRSKSSRRSLKQRIQKSFSQVWLDPGVTAMS